MICSRVRMLRLLSGLLLAAATVLAAGRHGFCVTEIPSVTPAFASSGPTAPRTLAGLWTGTMLPNDPRSLAFLETDDVTLMEYRLGQEPPVRFARAGGIGTRAAFHLSELFGAGGDCTVLERGPITILINGQAHRVMRLVVAQHGQRREAWYWFTAGGRTTPSYLTQQCWLVMDALRRRPAAGTLVHISSPMEDPRAVNRRLLAFVTALDRDAHPRQLARTHAPTPDTF